MGMEGSVGRVSPAEAVFKEELLKVLLTSLMDGELSQEARVRRSLEILKNEQEHVEQGQMLMEDGMEKGEFKTIRPCLTG